MIVNGKEIHISENDKEEAYMKERTAFILTIGSQNPRREEILKILDEPNQDTGRYTEIGWKYGQLLIAKSVFSKTLSMMSGDVHDLTPWTDQEKVTLVQVIQRLNSH